MDTLNDDPNHKFSLRAHSSKEFFNGHKGRIKGISHKLQYNCDFPIQLKTISLKSELRPFFSGFYSQYFKSVAAAVLLGIFLLLPADLMAAQVILAWDSVSDDTNLSEYHVYKRQAEGNYGNSPVWTGQDTTCNLTNLKDNTSYCFVARASNTEGIESENSNEVCYTPVVSSDDSTDDTTESDTDSDADTITDSDGDGMPDEWELEMGLDPTVDDSQKDLDGDSISNLDEYKYGSDPAVAAVNQPPLAPVCNYPIDGETVTVMTPELKVDAFTDIDSGDTLTKTQWKIIRAFDNLCVLDSTSETYLRKFKVPSWVLESETEYYWKVRFFDKLGAASDWSENGVFVTSIDSDDQDGDGVIDTQQAVSDNQDLNGDGVIDTLQPDTIKCIDSGYTKGVVGVGIHGTQGNNLISAVSNGLPEDQVNILNQSDILLCGMFEYRVEVAEKGSSVQVKIYFSEPVESDTQWYQLDVENNWIDYSEHTTFSSDNKSVVLELKDGGYGDIDGTENGVIVDRSGLMQTPQSSSSGATVISSLDWDSSDSCFISNIQKVNEVKRFYLWLAVAGLAMMVLSKLVAIWHDKFFRTKKVQ